MRDLAQAGRLNVATLYYHCGTKEQIIVAIHTRLVERVGALMSEVLGQEGEIGAKAAILVDRMIDLLSHNPSIALFMARAALGEIPSIREAEPAIYLPVLRVAIDELNRRADLGEIRRVDPARFIAAAQGVLLTLSLDGVPQREAWGDEPATSPANLEATKHMARLFVLGALGLDPAGRPLGR